MTLSDAASSLVNTVFACLPRTKPTALQAQKARLIAHRGAHDTKGVIENTLDAFARAEELGCFGIELDVQLTADKVLVVHHDETLKRLWNIDRPLAAMSFHSLRDKVPQIPTLEEVVSQFGKKTHLFIELKSAEIEAQALARILKPLHPQQDYHLLSLEESVFARLDAIDRQVMLLVPQVCNVGEFCALSLGKNYGGVMGHYLLMTRARIMALQAAGQKVGVGFIDSRFSLYRCLNRDIQWLFTNRCEATIKALKALNLSRDSF